MCAKQILRKGKWHLPCRKEMKQVRNLCILLPIPRKPAMLYHKGIG